MKRILRFFKINKKILIILGIVLVAISYFGYKRLIVDKNDDDLYFVKKIGRGSVKKIISGSGNIIAVDSFKIITKKAGEITFLPFSEGETVKSGTLLAQLDSRDIERQIRDTKLALESQINNLEKLKLNRINLENNLKELENQYQDLKRSDDLRKNYENNINLLNSFYADFPVIIRKIEDICFNKDFKEESINNNLDYYLSYFNKNYSEKSEGFKKDFDNFKNKFTKTSSEFYKLDLRVTEINLRLIQESYNLTIEMQNLIKSVYDPIRKIKEDVSLKGATHIYSDLIDNHFNSLKDYYEKLNNYSQSLLAFINQANTIDEQLKRLSIDIENINLNIKQSENEIKNLEISIEQTKNKITDLEADLKDYRIYSPISGVIDSLIFKKGDTISAGTILMVIFSADKIAEIKLNEVDVADVKVGQKAILTFDALPNIEIPGQVIEISPVGEISQGVVSYKVKIALQEKNKNNIKIGMTVNADIIVKSKDNVLIVPNKAIKINNDTKYVEVINEKDSLILNQKYSNLKDEEQKQIGREISVDLKYPFQVRFVRTGLNDETNTEILDGLEEGDWIVLKHQKDNRMVIDKQQQGLFQRFFPQPRRFIRSPAIK